MAKKKKNSTEVLIPFCLRESSKHILISDKSLKFPLECGGQKILLDANLLFFFILVEMRAEQPVET